MLFDKWQASCSLEPLSLQHYNISNTMLLDEGVIELLPLLACPAFGNLKYLGINSTRLTENCAEAFTEFLGSQFPEHRRLTIEMKILNIRNIVLKSSKINPLEQFKR